MKSTSSTVILSASEKGLQMFSYDFIQKGAYIYRELGYESGLQSDWQVLLGEGLINLVRLDVDVVEVDMAAKERHLHVVLIEAEEVVLEVLAALLKYFALDHLYYIDYLLQ